MQPHFQTLQKFHQAFKGPPLPYPVCSILIPKAPWLRQIKKYMTYTDLKFLLCYHTLLQNYYCLQQMIPSNKICHKTNFAIITYNICPRGMQDLNFLHVDDSWCKMTIEVDWRNSRRSRTNIHWDMASVARVDILSNNYYIREFPQGGRASPNF
jgi:hypothetical protein